MFFPEGTVRVHLYGRPVDMRKSFNGLHALARHGVGQDPLSGLPARCAAERHLEPTHRRRGARTDRPQAPEVRPRTPSTSNAPRQAPQVSRLQARSMMYASIERIAQPTAH